MIKNTLVFLFLLSPMLGFTLNKNNNKAPSTLNSSNFHYKHEVNIGVLFGVGYNVLSHVDGTLSAIPSKPVPDPTPGSPVYATSLSLTATIPSLSIEYWLFPSWSIETELAYNMVIVGADHALSDFAYLFQYITTNMGSRYYFSQFNVGYLFLGAGLSISFPVSHPSIGFIKSKGQSLLTLGPYAEIGINHPFNKTLSLTMLVRFTFNTLPLSKKDDPGMLAEIITSPLSLMFGMQYRI